VFQFEEMNNLTTETRRTQGFTEGFILIRKQLAFPAHWTVNGLWPLCVSALNGLKKSQCCSVPPVFPVVRIGERLITVNDDSITIPYL